MLPSSALFTVASFPLVAYGTQLSSPSGAVTQIIMTLSITTLRKMAFSVMTHSKMTLSITALGIIVLLCLVMCFYCNAERRYAECNYSQAVLWPVLYIYIAIITWQLSWVMPLLQMFARSINDTSRVVRMTIVGDTTTWSVIIESSFTIVICL